MELRSTGVIFDMQDGFDVQSITGSSYSEGLIFPGTHQEACMGAKRLNHQVLDRRKEKEISTNSPFVSGEHKHVS